MNALTPTALADKASISVPYASQLLSGVRKPGRPLAIRIYRATGKRFPPLAGLSDDEIDMLERIEGRAA